MPHYGAKDLSIRLSTANLQASTPQPARNVQVKNVVPRNHEAIALSFNEGDKKGVLAETSLHSDQDKLALRIIGHEENTPFTVVLAGEGSDPSPKPVALCLTVFLSGKCFKVNAQGQPGVAKDLKIDVFLDGVLCGSAFVSKRFATEKHKHSEKHKRTEHIVRFSGLRIGYALLPIMEIFKLTQDHAGQCLEKPWVLLTPHGDEDSQLASTQAENTTVQSNQLASTQAEDAAAESSQLASTQAENTTTEAKWNAVNATLLQYADEVGKDDTFLGKYLTSVASLPLPANVGTSGNEDMPPRSRPYGIFDVVLTAGKGAKDAPSPDGSLEKPTAMMLEKIRPSKPAQLVARKHVQNLTSLRQTPSTPATPLAQSANATPQHQEALSADEVPVKHTASAINGTTGSPEETLSLTDTAISAPHQSSKRYRISKEKIEAMPLADQVKGRHVMPKTFVPERVSGFDVREERSRQAYSDANSPQPPSSSVSPASTSIAAVTPTPNGRAPAVASALTATHPSTGGKVFTGPGSGYQPPAGRGYANVCDARLTQEEEMAAIKTAAKESALKPEPAPKPKSLVLVLKGIDFSKLATNAAKRKNDMKRSRPGSSSLSSPAAASSPLGPPPSKRRRLNANSADRVFMDAAEIARQEATFTPTPSGRVGYAAPGVVRQVRMERGGSFVEEEVVYGCRMLV